MRRRSLREQRVAPCMGIQDSLGFWIPRQWQIQGEDPQGPDPPIRSKIFLDSGFPYMRWRGIYRTINSEDIFLSLSAVNWTSPKIQRLSTVSSVVAAAGHVFSTRWHWYWQDENNEWQLYGKPTDGHAASTTNSQCLESEYLAGKKSASPLILP